LLGDIQAAYSAEDFSALRAKVTPEMLSYFSGQLAGKAIPCSIASGATSNRCRRKSAK
jgi:predicted lipid-binding transport protein (Tim44 family)